MMTLSPIKDFNYYKSSEHNDYYYDDEYIGEWFGSLVAEMGLPRHVSELQMDRVFSGIHPTTLEKLNSRSSRFGFDLTFSAPKSVSVLYAQSHAVLRQQVVDAHLASVKDALAYLELELVQYRVKDGSSTNGFGILAALQTHFTSRELDPQLHTHALLANLTLADNHTLRCMDTRVLYSWQKVLGAFYRVCLAQRLAGLGFTIESDNEAFRIKEIPKQLETHFSTRTQQIQEVLNRYSISSSASAAGDIAKLATRKKKVEVTNSEIEALWAQKLSSFTVNFGCLGAVTQTKESVAPRQDVLLRLTEKKSTFKKHDLYYEVLVDLQDEAVGVDGIYDALTAIEQNPELYPLTPSLLYTTRQVLRLEAEMLVHAEALSKTTTPALNQRLLAIQIQDFETKSGFKLDEEQRTALEHICFDESRLAIVQGSAGAGKTTVMAIVKTMYEQSGRDVIGACFTKKAADNLQDETGINSFTIDKLICDYDSSKNHFKNQSVLVLDEAGLVGTRKLNRIFEIANKENLKVILTGEDKQLDAIEHGGCLRFLTEKFGTKRIEKIFRQRQESQREIVPLLRDGQTKEALAKMKKLKMLNFCSDSESAIDKLIFDWIKFRKANPSKEFLISAAKWWQVDELAAKVRQVLIQEKQVSKNGVYVDCIVGQDGHQGRYQMAIGDKVRFTKNDYFLGVANGHTGQITDISGTDGVKFTIRLKDGRQVRIDAANYSNEDGRMYLVHAYATTVFSSQGLTVDGNTFILYDTSLDRDDTYVAGSRHRDKANWYVNVDQLMAGKDVVAEGSNTDQLYLELLEHSMHEERKARLAHEFICRQHSI